MAIERLDSSAGFFIIVDFNEAKATRLPGLDTTESRVRSALTWLNTDAWAVSKKPGTAAKMDQRFLTGARMLDEGVWAEVKVGGEHLRLFSEHNAQGVQASVYNVQTKKWIAPSEGVEDIEDGKDRAAAYAKAYLKHAASLELPPLQWKRARAQ